MDIVNDKKAQSPSGSIRVSDKTAEDFLLATQPCFVNFPPEMREKVREALQERVNRGDLSEKELAEVTRVAAAERALSSDFNV